MRDSIRHEVLERASGRCEYCRMLMDEGCSKRSWTGREEGMGSERQSDRFVYFFGAGQAEAGAALKHLVGGKGASLANMTKAGLNVPPGFTISAECCDLYYRANRVWPAGLEEEVRASLARLEQLVGRRFGVGDNPLLVAVRSGAAESMPGMMDTVLNVGLDAQDPWACLREAITAVFDSWNSERAVAYRQHHHIAGLLGTAVTVQAMCPAEVAGVMFTANPVNPGLEQILIESSYGLGEAIVLGKVTPDRFVLDKRTLEVRERTIVTKQPPHFDAASLNDAQLGELARLGLRVEAYFQMPSDIEWALSQGQFFLLQARAIKGARSASEGGLEQVRREEIAALEAKAEPTGTVWSRYNLSEILPEPTPMTWAIVRRFMSGKGGFGLMYRDLGFSPDPSLDEEGIYDLVCGRPYCNLSREPKMQYGRLPYDHPFARLKAEPQRALYAQAVPNPARAGWRFWLGLPLLFFRQFRTALRLRKLSRTFAERFRRDIVPPFVQEVAAEARRDLAQLDARALLERLEYWVRHTLGDFARDSLKPTALAALARSNLERALARLFGPHDGTSKAQAAIGQLTMAVRPDRDTDLAGAVRDLAAGRLDRTTFLERFGQRGSQEMELSQPRWAEDPSTFENLLTVAPVASEPTDPVQVDAWQHVAPGIQLSATQRTALEEELGRLHDFLRLRESAKHYLMMGYQQIRRILVELDRRYELDGGIFYLTPDELPQLVAALTTPPELLERIAQRQKRHALALSLPMPAVLFSDDLEAIGRPAEIADATVLHGVPLSAGVAEGVALVLLDPANATPSAEPFILVCPSTDPAWVPLFVQARGLVMETGGVLSHGAIVAREFGLPAVAGLPDIQHRVRTGQRLRIDGSTGTVHILT